MDDEKKEIEKTVAFSLADIQDVPAGTIKNALVKINIDDKAIADVKRGAVEIIAKYDGSKKSMEAVKAYRLSIRPIRTGVKKVAEEGRAEAREVQALWIDAERKVTNPLLEIEESLAKVEAEWEAVQQKERDRLVAIEKKKLDDRLEKLKAFEWDGNEFQVAQASDEQFTEIVDKAKRKFDELMEGRRAAEELKRRQDREAAELAETNRKEAERLAAEKKKQDEDAEKLRKEREAFEAEKAAALKKKEGDEKEAERKRLEKELADKKVELDKIEAENKRVAAENQRLANEKAEKEAADLKAKQDAIEAEKLAALAPDIDKMMTWAKAVWSVAYVLPNVTDAVIRTRLEVAKNDVEKLLDDLKIGKGK